MTLQKLPRDNKTERSLLLALYTEVTVPNALEDTEHATLTEVSITAPPTYLYYKKSLLLLQHGNEI